MVHRNRHAARVRAGASALRLARGSAILFTLAIAGSAAAQELAENQADDVQLQEVVVTAQKRQSTVEKTPISITAVSGEDLQERGIADLDSLAASVPGVSMKFTAPGQTEFEMRGLTSQGGNSPTVGFYLDDVPLTAPAYAQNGKVVIDPNLYDISRVEVLRGPQGTLYGSGSMGGTIKVITNEPKLNVYEGSAQAILSDTHGGGLNHDENVALNIPFVQNELAVRLVASESHTSGWIDRIVLSDFPWPLNGGLTRGDVQSAQVALDQQGSNATDLRGVRAALTWKPVDRLTLTPSIFYQRISQENPSDFDSIPGDLSHYEPFNVTEPYSDSITISNLPISYRLDGIDVTSVTSFWHRISSQVQDCSENCVGAMGLGPAVATFYGPTGTGPIPGTETDPSRQFSQEIRAASTGDDRLQWVAGAFLSRFLSHWGLYMNVDNPAAFGVTATDNVWDVDEPIHIDQKALFGEANYALTDRLKATAGVRWYEYTTRTQMSFSGFGGPTGTNVPYLSDVTQGSSGINPKAGLSYDLDKNLLVYGSVARGFRPGGGNWPLPIGNPSVGACISSGLQQIGYYGASPLTFDPDSVWSYEAGEKGKFLNNRLRVNASLYFEHWNNIQVAQLPCDYPLTVNAPGAHVYGTEVEVQALLSGNLSVSVNTGATHAVFTETARGFDAGDRLPDVAPWTASVNISYHHPLTDRHELTARLEDTYTGTRVDTTFPGGVTDFQTPLPGYNLTNVRVGVAADAGWSATAFIDNLFNKKASLENVAQLTLPNPSYNRVSTNQPLTAGIDLSYRF